MKAILFRIACASIFVGVACVMLSLLVALLLFAATGNSDMAETAFARSFALSAAFVVFGLMLGAVTHDKR